MTSVSVSDRLSWLSVTFYRARHLDQPTSCPKTSPITVPLPQGAPPLKETAIDAAISHHAQTITNFHALHTANTANMILTPGYSYSAPCTMEALSHPSSSQT